MIALEDIATIEGTPGVTLAEIGHLIIPGRGRNSSGMGLSYASIERGDYATEVDASLGLSNRESSVIVCSGYKTPGDMQGEPWAPHGQSPRWLGVPEAYSLERLLVVRGIEERRIRREAASIDTTTNFLYAQCEFPDDEPVGIVAQQQHLERIIDIIAPRTMRRDYIGIVVPELSSTTDEDGHIPRIISRVALAGTTTATLEQKAISRTEWRVKKIWAATLAAQALKDTILHRDTTSAYHTDSS